MPIHVQNVAPSAMAGPVERGLDPDLLARGNINPQTGLATDFLNHFNEVIMLLDMLPGAPEFVEDILIWQPLSYRDYFAASHFKERELAILAYEAADPFARADLEAYAEEMNRDLLAMLAQFRSGLSAQAAAALGTETADRLKPIVARAGAVINGGDEAAPELADQETAQMLVDALFGTAVP